MYLHFIVKVMAAVVAVICYKFCRIRIGQVIRIVSVIVGLVQSLNGLNLRNNPLEFPPANILAKGVKKISLFLKNMLNAKNDGNLENIYSESNFLMILT